MSSPPASLLAYYLDPLGPESPESLLTIDVDRYVALD
jgi:hypothetical protein